MRKFLVSFAQENEDIVLYHILRDVNKVFWIDVGANDPIYISVTELFYRKGGSGINIEPLIEYKERYDKLRKRDINLFVAVAQEEGSMKLYGEGVNASLNIEGQNVNSYREVPIKRLDNICELYLKKGQEIHFLKIDVELYEREVLLSADFSKFRPWIVVVESISHARKTYSEWEDILINAGYLFAYEDPIGLNRYYVSKEKSELIEGFNQLVDLDQMYYIEKNYCTIEDTSIKDKLIFGIKHNFLTSLYRRGRERIKKYFR